MSKNKVAINEWTLRTWQHLYNIPLCHRVLECIQPALNYGFMTSPTSSGIVGTAQE